MYTVYKEHTNLLCQKEIVSAVLPSKPKPKKVPPYVLARCGSLSIFHPHSVYLNDFVCVPPCHRHHLLQRCHTDTQSAVSSAGSPRHCQSGIKNHTNLELHRTFRNKIANIPPPPPKLYKWQIQNFERQSILLKHLKWEIQNFEKQSILPEHLTDFHAFLKYIQKGHNSRHACYSHAVQPAGFPCQGLEKLQMLR